MQSFAGSCLVGEQRHTDRRSARDISLVGIYTNNPLPTQRSVLSIHSGVAPRRRRTNMLSTRPCVAHLPPIPIPPLDLGFSHRSPSLCSTASSSSIHSTYTSSSSSYPASGSSSTCPPSFQDAQTEAPHLRRKGSRPLPSIPSTSTTPTSAGISTPPCSASSAGRSSLRPLPRPPVTTPRGLPPPAPPLVAPMFHPYNAFGSYPRPGESCP